MARVDWATIIVVSSKKNGMDVHIDLLDSGNYLLSQQDTYTEIHTSFDEALKIAKALADK